MVDEPDTAGYLSDEVHAALLELFEEAIEAGELDTLKPTTDQPDG